MPVRNSRKVKLDPSILIPEGAEDIFSYANQVGDEFFDDTEIDIDGVEVLSPPQQFTVVSQTLREVKGAGWVVDVVIETEDYGTGVELEARISNAGTVE